MVDQETGSLWSQMMGMAMRGPLVGNSLEKIPALMTTWSTWKAKYPDTTVFYMERTSGMYTRDFLGLDRGIGIGLVIDGESKFWDIGRLASDVVVNDKLGKTSVLAVIDRDSLTAAVYSRHIGTRELTFELVAGRLIDVETKSTWDILTGEAIAGDFNGQRLIPLPGISTAHAAWSLYYPDEDSLGPTLDQAMPPE